MNIPDIFQRFFNFAIKFSALSLAVIFIVATLHQMSGRNEADLHIEEEKPSPVAALDEGKPSVVLSVKFSPPTEPGSDLIQPRLKRYEELRKKALLKDEELVEKHRLLSHLKTIEWIESQLSSAATTSSLEQRERLMFIDTLEDCLTWKENPIRQEVFDSIEKIIQKQNIEKGETEKNREIVGDKIELFALLAQEAPQRARELQSRNDDPKITKIINYAIKRLSLTNKLKAE